MLPLSMLVTASRCRWCGENTNALLTFLLLRWGALLPLRFSFRATVENEVFLHPRLADLTPAKNKARMSGKKHGQVSATNKARMSGKEHGQESAISRLANVRCAEGTSLVPSCSHRSARLYQGGHPIHSHALLQEAPSLPRCGALP